MSTYNELSSAVLKDIQESVEIICDNIIDKITTLGEVQITTFTEISDPNKFFRNNISIAKQSLSSELQERGWQVTRYSWFFTSSIFCKYNGFTYVLVKVHLEPIKQP